MAVVPMVVLVNLVDLVVDLLTTTVEEMQLKHHRALLLDMEIQVEEAQHQIMAAVAVEQEVKDGMVQDPNVEVVEFILKSLLILVFLVVDLVMVLDIMLLELMGIKGLHQEDMLMEELDQELH